MSDFITIDDLIYPEKLRLIDNSPQKLFYKGNLNLLNEFSIAIVGTRHITNYGKKYTKKFAKDIALRDVVIVSGMAVGVDRVAHEECLNVDGKTIAVLGSGFNKIFPKENIDIFNRILKQDGLIITEYEDDAEPNINTFPARNRIVSGLSEGVLVVESAYRSGTSITAGLAIKQGKKVYAIPNRLDSTYGVGVNHLIQRGAKLVTCAEDILADFPSILKRKKRLIVHNSGIKKEYRKIYELLDEEPKSIEEISLKTKNTVRCTAKLLTLMEIEDLVEQIIGVRLYKEK